jgi:hypothetical protein
MFGRRQKKLFMAKLSDQRMAGAWERKSSFYNEVSELKRQVTELKMDEVQLQLEKSITNL